LKTHDELIEEMAEQLELGGNDEDATNDDDDGNPGDVVAHEDDVESEDEEDSEMLILEQEPKEMKVLGPEEEPEPPSTPLQPSLYM
jgi:hypothetical protein